MSGTVNAYDNAVVESFFSTLKSERIYRWHYAMRSEAQADIFLYIEGLYNHHRLHSTLGYLSLDNFKRQFSLQKSQT
ncbi:IS3 family transposase [bacterium]|nr:IS3 family transposase [bacterium]